MPRFLANRFAEVCGLVTSLLSAAIVIGIEQWLNFSIFTLTFWVIVPIGAYITGLAAASGYYLGAVWTNRPPSKPLLVNMVAIAAGTFFLIYYLQYRLLEVDGKAISDFVSFGRFLQVTLTKAEYGLMRAPNSTFEVGVFGYVIGAVQFLAFACGGFTLYVGLRAKAFCQRCTKYFRQVAKHQKTFATETEFQPFSNRLYSLSPPSAEYLHILKEPHEVLKPKPGAVAVEWSLLSCQTCGDQLLQEVAKVRNAKNEWKEVEKLKRAFPVASGLPLLAEMRAAAQAKNYVAVSKTERSGTSLTK